MIIIFVKLAVILIELLKSRSDVVVGFRIPKPPNLTGRATILLSKCGYLTTNQSRDQIVTNGFFQGFKKVGYVWNCYDNYISYDNLYRFLKLRSHLGTYYHF